MRFYNVTPLRLLIIGLAFLWSGVLFGQTIIGRPILPLQSSFTPESIADIRYWWVSEDLALGAVSANWIDRINGYGLGNPTAGSTQPTNTAIGVHFNGAQILTNSPTFNAATNGVSDAKGSVFCVLTPVTPAGSFGCILGTFTPGWGFYTTSGGIFREFGEGGSPTFGSYVSSTSLDMVVNMTSTTSVTNAFYLNGALVEGPTAAGKPSGVMGSVGRETGAGSNPFKGYIMEIAYWSRQLTAAEITSLHDYASAKYGY